MEYYTKKKAGIAINLIVGIILIIVSYHLAMQGDRLSDNQVGLILWFGMFSIVSAFGGGGLIIFAITRINENL